MIHSVFGCDQLLVLQDRGLVPSFSKSLDRGGMLGTPLHTFFLGFFQAQDYLRHRVKALDELDRTILITDVSRKKPLKKNA